MIDKRDRLIKDMTQKIALMVAALRDDPQFSRCNRNSLDAYSGMVTAKYSGLSYLNSQGISMDELKALSVGKSQ